MARCYQLREHDCKVWCVELIAGVADTGASEALRDRWWDEAQLPTNMGGCAVGGNALTCDVNYCHTLLACAPRLSTNVSLLCDVDVATSDMPMFKSLRRAWDRIIDVRDSVAETYAKEFDNRPYHMVDGTLFKDMYHPDRLPRKIDSIADILERPKEHYFMPATAGAHPRPASSAVAQVLACGGAVGCGLSKPNYPVPGVLSLHLCLPGDVGWGAGHLA